MKTILSILLLTLSAHVSAEGCWEIYQAEADKINKEDGYSQHVGGQIVVNPLSGQLGYWPGIKVAADIDNWAEDFVYAVKYGPMIFTSKEDPRLAILKTLYKEIKADCPLKDKQEKFDTFRAMLKELMDDGSFCPNNKMLERPFLSRWKNFKKVLKDSVSKGQFQAQCHNISMQDDSHREVKESGGTGEKSQSHSEAAAQ